jgi:hypothetical protein
MSEQNAGYGQRQTPWTETADRAPLRGQSQAALGYLTNCATYIARQKGKAGTILLGLIAWQLIAQPGSKPGDILGRFYGSVEVADYRTKQDAARDYAGAQATAAANAQARAQTLHEAMGAETAIANLGDFACAAASQLPAGDGWDDWKRLLAHGCGIGDGLRNKMAEDYSGVTRERP